MVQLTGATSRYAAFLSYHRGTDGELAAALQETLHKLGKPWYRPRALNVFRDLAVLPASSDAWEAVREALDESEFLILLASPQAATSEWVSREVAHWLATKPKATILIAFTAGGLVWDRAAGDFDWSATTALPEVLRGQFAAEPSWVDLRATRLLPKSARLRVWQVAVAPLAAALHHTTVDQVLRDEDRVYRRNWRTAVAAVAALTVLTVASGVLGITAAIQTGNAREQARIAQEQRRVAVSRQLAAQSGLIGSNEPDVAALLAVASHRLDANDQSDRAVTAAVGRRARKVLATLGPLVPVQTPDGRPVSTGRPGHSGVVWDVAVSSDGTLVVTGGDDGNALVWDAHTGALIATLAGHRDDVRDVAISPDGRTVATASDDDTARLWDARSGAVTAILSGDASDVTALAFSPDATILATAHGDGSVRLWNPRTGTLTATLAGHTAKVQAIAFSPDGTALVTAGQDGLARLWNVASGTQTATLPGHALPLSVLEAPAASVFDRGPVGATAAAFSPDGHIVVTADMDGAVYRWRTATGERIDTLPGHTDGVNEIAFSADGTTLATASRDGTVRVWNADSGEATLTLAGHAQGPGGTAVSFIFGEHRPVGATAVAFRPHGGVLATADGAGTVSLWATATGKRVAALAGHTDAVTAMAFSSDGSTLATSSLDRSARLWDAATLTLAGGDAAVRAVAFSRDGATPAPPAPPTAPSCCGTSLPAPPGSSPPARPRRSRRWR